MQIRILNPKGGQKPEPTVALINVVFLMLIFFLIAGTIAPPIDPELALINTADLEGREPPQALVVHADGSLTYRQQQISVADYVGGLSNGAAEPLAVRVVPDQNLPAVQLIELGVDLRAQGVEQVFIVTERALQ